MNTADIKQVTATMKKRTLWEEFLHRCWSAVEIGPDCEGCRYLKETKDAFGTGDSPSDYDCLSLTAKNCPRLFEDECDVGQIAYKLFQDEHEQIHKRYGV